MKKIALIDNYDSFTYNLLHYLEQLNATVTVFRNDAFELEDLEIFDKILLSPGPGIPDEAGQLKLIILRYSKTKSILGICLGQQAIGEFFGGSLVNLEKVQHGVTTHIRQTEAKDYIFKGLPNSFDVGRYHSWIVSNDNFPSTLEITAIDDNDQIMALRPRELDVRGVQFHPESILTTSGHDMIGNFVQRVATFAR